MRILLTIQTEKTGAIIPVNYQYPLSSAIYRILQNADSAYSGFLHEKGYGKGFKLFSFSDLETPFKIIGDRLSLLTDTARLTICFHLPRAAETFIKGLFMSQQIYIADKKNKANFTVQNVEVINNGLENYKDDEFIESVLKPVSPIVCDLKNEKGEIVYLSPEEDCYEEMIFKNWQEKVRSVLEKTDADYLMHDAFMRVLYFKNPPKSRLIAIKAGTKEETKIRAFNNFLIEVKGRRKVVEILLNAGVGRFNAQGMGCVEFFEEG